MQGFLIFTPSIGVYVVLAVIPSGIAIVHGIAILKKRYASFAFSGSQVIIFFSK